MNLNLSDNIRAFRKARSLTQQQLADALGVTPGAVYKWEANLSAPDLSLLVELADLFDTSVDALLGYDVKDNKQSTVVLRLKELMRNRDKRGLAEADKALARYPNGFQIVYQSAELYATFGMMSRSKELLKRSIGLMERAILLIDQNTDPEISEISIYKDMAIAYFNMNEADKAVEILKANNPCDINDDLIGEALASECDSPNEALSYLSIALLKNISSLTRIVMGYYNVYFKTQDFTAAVDILQVILDFFAHLRKDNCFIDKIRVCFYICLAMAHIKLEDIASARKALRAAKALAQEFDRMPNYKVDNIRFVSMEYQAAAFDSFGDTALDCIANTLNDLNSSELSALWKEIESEA